MNIRRAACALPVFLLLLPCAAAVRTAVPVPAAEQAKAKAAGAQFAQGAAAMKAKQYDAALKSFEAVVAAFPKAVPAWVNMGVIYRLKNEPARAEITLKRAMALAPSDPVVLRALADIYVTQKRWGPAAPLLRRASTLLPRDAMTRAATGEVEMALGNTAAAETQFRAAVRLQPDLLPAHRSLATLYSAQRRTADLRRELLAIQKATPNDPKVAFSLGILYAQSNEPKPALVQFRKAAALDPSNIQAAVNIAQIQLQLGQAKQADASFRSILKARPGDPQAHFALGVIAYNKKQFAVAEKHFRAVLAAPGSQRNIGARINLAGTLLNQGKAKEAAAQYEIVLESAPKNKQVYGLLAAAYQRQGLNEQATQTYKRLLAIDPNDVGALSSVAMASQFGGKPDDAIPYYERLLKLKPSDQMALQMLSGLYAGKKDTAKAVALFKPLLAKDKSKHADIARIYSQAGENEKAVQELKDWTKEQPKSVAPWLALADQYQSQPVKNDIEAKAAYDAAKRADPKSIEPYRRQAQYLQRQNKLDDALKELAEVPANATDLDQVYQMAGSILEIQKKPDEAAAQYRLAAKANPKLASSYRQSLARVLLDAGKTDEAIAEYRAGAAKNPKDGYIQSGLAKALEKKGDKAGAIAAWRKSGALNKFDRSWLDNVARLQDESGQGATAVQTLLAAYAKAPGDAAISKQLIPIAERANKLDEVVATFNKAAEKGPTNPPLYSQLGDVYTRKDVASAPAGLPGPQATASGIEVFREYLRRFPKNEGIARAFASYATARGRWKDVVTANRALLAIRPDDSNTRTQIADALAKSGDQKGAEAEYKAILKMDDRSAAAHLALAKLYETQNLDIAARAEYEAVRRIDPSNQDATTALSRLKAPVGAAPTSITPPGKAPPPTPAGLASPIGR